MVLSKFQAAFHPDLLLGLGSPAVRAARITCCDEPMASVPAATFAAAMRATSRIRVRPKGGGRERVEAPLTAEQRSPVKPRKPEGGGRKTGGRASAPQSGPDRQLTRARRTSISRASGRLPTSRKTPDTPKRDWKPPRKSSRNGERKRVLPQEADAGAPQEADRGKRERNRRAGGDLEAEGADIEALKRASRKRRSATCN